MRPDSILDIFRALETEEVKCKRWITCFWRTVTWEPSGLPGARGHLERSGTMHVSRGETTGAAEMAVNELEDPVASLCKDQGDQAPRLSYRGSLGLSTLRPSLCPASSATLAHIHPPDTSPTWRHPKGRRGKQ